MIAPTPPPCHARVIKVADTSSLRFEHQSAANARYACGGIQVADEDLDGEFAQDRMITH